MSSITPKIDLLTRVVNLSEFTLHNLHKVTHCSRAEIKAFHDQLRDGGYVETADQSGVITSNTPLTLNEKGKDALSAELLRTLKPFTVPSSNSPVAEEKYGLSEEKLTATTENDPRPLYRLALHLGVFSQEQLREETIGVSKFAHNEFSKFLTAQDHAIMIKNGNEPIQYRLKSLGEYNLTEMLERADYDSQFEPRAA